jgi:hypothetical protein
MYRDGLKADTRDASGLSDAVSRAVQYLRSRTEKASSFPKLDTFRPPSTCTFFYLYVSSQSRHVSLSRLNSCCNVWILEVVSFSFLSDKPLNVGSLTFLLGNIP